MRLQQKQIPISGALTSTWLVQEQYEAGTTDTDKQPADRCCDLAADIDYRHPYYYEALQSIGTYSESPQRFGAVASRSAMDTSMPPT